MGENQFSTKQRNGVLSRLNPNNKSRSSKRDFVDEGESLENELRRFGCLTTRRRFYDAESSTKNMFKLSLF